MAEINLKEEFGKIARKIEMLLRGQAPSSNLAGAVQVTYEDNGFAIALDDSARYGIYLWRGTGNERAAGASDDIQATYDAIWDRRYDPNPGPGKGGIKPRYWLNLKQADIMELQTEIEEAIAAALEKQLEKTSA
jgi:hypothetical protein